MKSKHEKKSIRIFMDKAREHQLDISSFELWRRVYVIGIDRERFQLLYIKFGTKTEEILLDLAKVKKVSVVDEQQERGSGNGRINLLEKLWLSFSFKAPNMPDILLEFYNADETMGLGGEPLLIKKWEKRFQDLLDEMHKKAPQINEKGEVTLKKRVKVEF